MPNKYIYDLNNEAIPDSRGSRSLFIAALVLILIATLYPFQFWADPLPLRYYDSHVVSDGASWLLSDFLLNVLLFVPMGFGCAELFRFAAARAVPVLLSGGASALVSFAVEGAQLMLPSRYPSLCDVIANTSGGLIGGLCFVLWEDRILILWWRIARASEGLTRIRRPEFVLSAFLVLMLTGASLLQIETRLSNWDDRFPLLLGNERTGDRPWVGRIQQLEVATRALRPDNAYRALRANLSELLPDAVFTSYRFGTAVNTPLGQSAGLAWKGADPPHGEDTSKWGLLIPGTKWLESEIAGTAISRAVRRDGQLTVRLVCWPATLAQKGPARIASISADPYNRNFTVGQEDSAMVLRLRTPLTGTDGSEPELVIPTVFSADVPRTIVITYDGATITILSDAAAEHVYRFPLSPGAVLASAVAPLDPHELLGQQLVFVALMLFPAGLLLGLLMHQFSASASRRLVVLSAGSFLMAVALETAVTASSGGFFDWLNVIVGILCCITGARCIPLKKIQV